MGSARRDPVTADRIERALIVVAHIVARDPNGEVYAPILDRLEAELAAMKKAETPQRRAQKMLEAYGARQSGVLR